MIIIWEELLKGYNRIYKKNYKTVKSMLSGLYSQTKSLTQVSDLLGVSRPSLSTKMKKLGIEVKGKGGDNSIGEKRVLFLKISPEEMKEMTWLEISKRCKNASHSYIKHLAKRYNRKIRSLR